MRRSPYGFEFFENCATCHWRTERFFCAVAEDALSAFDRLAFTNVAPQHSVLFSEGESPRGIYVICHGAVKLSMASGDGKTLIVHVGHPGECLGLSSVIAGHEYHTTAETLEPTQVKFVKREDFLRFLEQYPQSYRNASMQLAQQAESENDQIRSIGLSHSAAEKLAHLLLTWCIETGRAADDGIRVQVLMTHQDISQLIGTSRETVTRLLKDFRDQQIISMKGSTLIIRDRTALESMVSM